MRKIVALILTMVLCAGSVMPAMAAEPIPGGDSYELSEKSETDTAAEEDDESAANTVVESSEDGSVEESESIEENTSESVSDEESLTENETDAASEELTDETTEEEIKDSKQDKDIELTGDGTEYGIWIGSEQFTDEKPKIYDSYGEGYAEYSPETGTLTFTNFIGVKDIYTAQGDKFSSLVLIFNAGNDITIKGTASLYPPSSGTCNYGIYVRSQENLTIDKDAKIFVRKQVVNAVSTRGTLEINGNLTVEINADNAHGIYSETKVEINGGKTTVTAYADNAIGIHSATKVEINGGKTTVTAEGKNARGIYSDTEVEINGGETKVSVSGKDATAIKGGDICINEGEVRAECNYQSTVSGQAVVSGTEKNIRITGGYLVAECPKGTYSAVHSDKGIIIDDKAYLWNGQGLNEKGTDILTRDGLLSFRVAVTHPEWYPVWVGNEQVNSENYSFITEGIIVDEGDWGGVKYDPETHTLEFVSVKGVTGAHTVSGESYKIYCEGDLTVTGDAVISDVTVDHVIGASGKLTIQGEMDLSSNKTVVTADKISVDAISLSAKCKSGAAVIATTDITVTEGHTIVTPAGGKISNNGRYIASLDGVTEATEVKVTDDKGKAYDIWIGGVQVTSLNMDKVPGIKGGGSVKVAPDTKDHSNMVITFEGNVTGTESLYSDSDGKTYYIYSKLPIIIRGGASFTSGECTNGIYSDDVICVEGNITVSADECAVSSGDAYIDVSNGGVLDATSAGSCAISAEDKVGGCIFINNGEIKAKSTGSGSSAIVAKGFYGFKFTSGKIIAEGGLKAVDASTVSIDESDTRFIIPAGGSVNGDETEIMEADGTTVAKKIHIEKEYAEEWYDLYVGRTHINSNNKDAIPGILGGGSASYDPETHTLTFTGKVTGLDGYSYRGEHKTLIHSYYNGLTISGDASFNDSDAGYGIFFSANNIYKKLVIDGNIELHTKGYSIFVDRGDMEINGSVYAQSDEKEAICACQNLEIYGNVRSVCPDDKDGIYIGGDIEIKNGSVETSGISVTEGEITIADGLDLLIPEGGRISDSKKTVVDASGNKAAKVMIGKAKADHRVKFDLKGRGEKDDVIVEDGSTLMKPADPTAEGYTFAGWYCDDKCTVPYNFASLITSDLTLYAKWIKGSVIVHTVSFNMNEHGSPVATQKVESGKKAVCPADPVDSSYVFAGWYADSTCTAKFDFKKPITSDTEIYAKWEPVPDNGMEVYFVLKNGLTYNSGSGRYEHFYTGGKIEPAVTVVSRQSGKTTDLSEGTDYTIKYSNNVNVDKKGKPAVVTITGKGNYKGSKKILFYVLPVSIGNGTDAVPSSDIKLFDIKVKSGTKVSPVLYYGSYKLTSKDYDLKSKTGKLKFSEADPDADRKLTITGKGNFSGAIVEAPVTILTAKQVKDSSVNATIISGVSRTYDGTEQILADGTELIVKDGTGAKILPTNYEAIYTANVNAGTAKVTVIGKGEYTGTSTKTFKIKPDKDKSTVTASVAASHIYYDKKGAKPKVAVTAEKDGKKKQLIEGKDYKVSYSSNKSVTDKAKFTVSFIGNYKGRKSVPKTFRIEPAVFNASALTVVASDMIYKKPGKYVSVPIVTANGVLLGSKDYTVTYWIGDKEITNVRDLIPEADITSVDIVIKGKGNYESAEIKVPDCYSVRKVGTGIYDLSQAKITMKGNIKKAIPAQEYTGSGVEPSIDLWIKVDGVWKTASEIGLTAGSDYTVSYVNNVARGKGTVVVRSLSVRTAGSKSAKFTIGQSKLSSLIERLHL